MTNMPDGRKKLGNFGEQLARRHLETLGYKILETNYRCPIGEIDIVARQDDTLVFVEVRTRRGSEFGTPEESITPAKKEKLISLAEHYSNEHLELPPNRRIDVVAIEIGRRGGITRIEVVENAIN